MLRHVTKSAPSAETNEGTATSAGPPGRAHPRTFSPCPTVALSPPAHPPHPSQRTQEATRPAFAWTAVLFEQRGPEAPPQMSSYRFITGFKHRQKGGRGRAEENRGGCRGADDCRGCTWKLAVVCRFLWIPPPITGQRARRMGPAGCRMEVAPEAVSFVRPPPQGLLVRNPRGRRAWPSTAPCAQSRPSLCGRG